MKIWHGYGSEHSMNLVMIGRFKEANHAAAAQEAIELLTAQVNADTAAKRMEIGEPTDRYSDEMLLLLRRLKLSTIGPGELVQFAYDCSIETDDNRLELRTDESDVSAFLKVLIEREARIELYSTHHYPDDASDAGDENGKC